MNTSNYLVSFLQDVDVLISEINKLESKIRLYKSNCEKFNMNFDVKFSLSKDMFVTLRKFLAEKIENYYGYDSKIVNLRREFLKNYGDIIRNIHNEIYRIDYIQELQLNGIAKEYIYKTKLQNELKLRDMYDVKSSFFEKILGIKKFRKLKYENHDLKAKLLQKQYEEDKKEGKTVFELACMIESCEVKTGGLLCLQDDIIKSFMIDRKVVKKENNMAWRMAVLVPHGFGAKKQYYKVLNKNLEKENIELKGVIENDRSGEISESSFNGVNLKRLSSKLARVNRITQNV